METIIQQQSEGSSAEEQTLRQIIHDSMINGEITPQLSMCIHKLFEKYRKNTVEKGDVIISVETGMSFGNLVIYDILEVESAEVLKYERGNYDRVTASVRMDTTLWTDFDSTEPYNRQGSLYADQRFSNLRLVKTTGSYREFVLAEPRINSTSLCFPGYTYKNIMKTVSFGICLPGDKKEEFIRELRILLDK